MTGRYCLQVFALSLVAHIAPSFVFGQVVLPNNQLLGKDATTSQTLFQATDAKSPIFPSSIQVDVKDGKIRGLIAKYEKGIAFQVVKDAINQHNQKWQIPDTSAPSNKDINLTLWRNEDERFAIQLHAKKGDDVEMIVLPFSTVSVPEIIERLRDGSDKSPAP